MKCWSYDSESNFSRFGPAITPVRAKTTRDATPQKLAEVFNSPTANVANKIGGMNLLKLVFIKQSIQKERALVQFYTKSEIFTEVVTIQPSNETA